MPSPRSRRGVGLRAAEQNAGVFADFAQPGAFSNAARGAVAGLLGLPGDVSQMVEAGVNQLPVAAQVPIRGLLGNGAIEGAELPTSERVAGLLGADLSRPSTQAGLIGAPDPRDIGRAAILPIFRGEMRGVTGSFSKGTGRFFSEDPDFARQFTQTGQESELLRKTIDDSDIFDASDVFAGDPDLVDEVVEQARSQGFKAVRLSEGMNEPTSIFVFDRTAVR